MSNKLRILLVGVSLLLIAGRPVPSGPSKAFKGPEGEIITMVEANDSKQMLVHFKNVGGEIDGMAKLYEFEDDGKGRKGVFTNKKRGSKTERFYILTARDGVWRFYHPTKKSTEFNLKYSELDSEKMKVNDILNVFKP